MCGIFGIFAPGAEPATERELTTMGDSLRHRGPDDSGVWIGDEGRVGVGQRRLSIIDLSPAGRQPMTSACGRYTLVYNGEIYNFLELKRELPDYPYRGTSDSEALLAAITTWGLERTLDRVEGMFAIGLWDAERRTLTLIRDHAGIKPLYYYWDPVRRLMVFGSEMRALLASGRFSPEEDPAALRDYMRFQHIPAPRSIFRDVWKLLPGHLIEFRVDGGAPVQRAYWSLPEAARAAMADPFHDSNEALEQIDATLRSSVRLSMISDVPLGCWLSGGIDSSLIASYMVAESDATPHTYSIGFREPDYNEAEHAKAIAERLGATHHEHYVTAEDARKLIERLPEVLDEPFADSSIIPVLILSEFSRRHVTVALSGDGGDELFCGYNRHFFANQYWPKTRKIPAAARGLLSRILLGTPGPVLGGVVNTMSLVAPALRRYEFSKDKFHKLAYALRSPDLDHYYREMLSAWSPDELFLDGEAGQTGRLDQLCHTELPSSPPQRLMALDFMTYMQDDVLTKVDRAAMWHSLEARVPFLNKSVIEAAWRVPLEFHLKGGEGKQITRELLSRHIPRELFERPKTGFALPLEHWFRGELKEQLMDTVASDSFNTSGLFNMRAIRKCLQEHISGKRQWQAKIWTLYAYQLWRQGWK